MKTLNPYRIVIICLCFILNSILQANDSIRFPREIAWKNIPSEVFLRETQNKPMIFIEGFDNTTAWAKYLATPILEKKLDKLFIYEKGITIKSHKDGVLKVPFLPNCSKVYFQNIRCNWIATEYTTKPKSLDFQNTTCNQGIILAANDVRFVMSKFDTLIITDVDDSCSLYFSAFTTSDAKISINNMGYLTTDGKMLFDNFDLEYEKFTYKYPEGIETDLVFRSLIKSQEKIGNYDGLKKAQIEYKNYQYLSKNKKFTNWINKWWWSYGYEKEKIIWNSILIFLIISFINCPFLFLLLKNLYSIDNIAAAVSQNQENKFFKRLILNMPYSLMYSGLIFFGVHFSIKNLCLKSENIKNQFIHHLLILYFFIIYIGGLICIGYISNVIITI